MKRFATIVRDNYTGTELDELRRYARDREARRLLRDGISRNGGALEMLFLSVWCNALAMEEEMEIDRKCLLPELEESS